MSERDVRERDILVAANEYAYVQDLTKGDIVLYVGPTKISLSNTERIVELRGDRFVPVRADDASFGVSAFITASSAQYIVLENPAKEGQQKPIRGSNASSDLLVGRKVVVPGPATFPLLPGQRARVIDGHPLREDEYLVVRYYDHVEGDPHPIGSEVVIRGSDVSFYIPVTGLEVLPTSKGTYVRKAWRFPKPGGLHVRVTKPMTVTEGADERDALPAGHYAAGTDVFLEDGDGYFFPSENVEVIAEVRPIPIAEKEGIYVRDKATGRITTVTGPTNYLPDPTREEVVPRLLPGPVAVYVPPSYAVLVLGKTKREVVVGPQTRILDYDEELEVLSLSTGRPKTDEHTLDTSMLQIDGNKVSDVVRVKTADHVELDITLSYRVSFPAREDRERWFKVKDYVGLLCDHLGSILRGVARSQPIDAFTANATELLRTAILGEKPRSGKSFEENGMLVYDVEVLDVNILDPEVKKLLANAQRAAIVAEVSRREHERRREVNAAEAATFAVTAELERARALAAIELRRLEHESTAAALEREAALERSALEARVTAFERQMQALAPELVATLRALGHEQLTAELSKNVAPLAILGGSSVTEVVGRVLGSLPIGAQSTVAEVLAKTPSTNGNAPKPPRA